jgi:hypothetical protein
MIAAQACRGNGKTAKQADWTVAAQRPSNGLNANPVDFS